MESLNVPYSGLQLTNYSHLLSLMEAQDMLPDANSRVLTTSITESVLKEIVSPAVTRLDCDFREVACRDGRQCYLRTQRCDFRVDCQDDSDEDDCSCKERLGVNRLCDGYPDCPGGEDEQDCGCEAGQFFCSNEEDERMRRLQCVAAKRLCDGVADCRNGRDEEDCLLLGPREGGMDQGGAGTQGVMYLREGGDYLALGLARDQASDMVFLQQLVGTACAGLGGTLYFIYRPGEISSSGLTLYDQQPSYELVKGQESDSVLRLERDWSRRVVEGEGLQLLQVGGRGVNVNDVINASVGVIKGSGGFYQGGTQSPPDSTPSIPLCRCPCLFSIFQYRLSIV